MSLDWIKLYANLPEHPRSDALESALNTPRAWTHLVELWLWVSKVRADGNIADVADIHIAKRAGWTGDAALFVNALRATGWLGDDGQLRGWEEHQGAHRDKAEKDRIRQRERYEARKATRDSKDAPPVLARGSAENPASRAGEKRREEKREEESERAPAAPLAPALFFENEPAAITFDDRLLERARGAVVADNRNARNATTAEAEAIYGRPQTVEAMLDHVVDGEPLGRAWAKRFGALDGQAGRPTIAEKVAVLWEASKGKRWGVGGAVVVAWFVSKLGEDNDRHRRAWERDGGATSSTSGTHPLWAAWRAERDRGDVPPFEDWLRKRDDVDGARSGRPRSTGSGGTPRTVSAVIADANAEAAAVWADSKAFEGGLALMKAATSKAKPKTTTEVADG